MATTDVNTNPYQEISAGGDIHFSDMASALVNISFAQMSNAECLQLMQCCQETHAGLCHCLALLGETLSNPTRVEEAGAQNQQRLGHSLYAIGLLAPALNALESFLQAELRERTAR
ncbi:hypothetical protein ACP26F_13565 [Franconibacter pulveris 1160]|jgi:hypothetical protein|uniref:Uncharacterized protein n=2 Tax=Franconibacter TaxID=1649295 RepID=A0A0J8Y695_9ENTR|nr:MULTISPECIES: hypothetical protein [Franconibacter]KMV32934.1 hypothetical protein ACH50_19580 [Franconibacter pulveris]MEB5922697.1 hypothetical protein [Franconibacter daqui]